MPRPSGTTFWSLIDRWRVDETAATKGADDVAYDLHSGLTGKLPGQTQDAGRLRGHEGMPVDALQPPLNTARCRIEEAETVMTKNRRIPGHLASPELPWTTRSYREA
jgi:hypothetical protein